MKIMRKLKVLILLAVVLTLSTTPVLAEGIPMKKVKIGKSYSGRLTPYWMHDYEFTVDAPYYTTLINVKGKNIRHVWLNDSKGDEITYWDGASKTYEQKLPKGKYHIVFEAGSLPATYSLKITRRSYYIAKSFKGNTMVCYKTDFRTLHDSEDYYATGSSVKLKLAGNCKFFHQPKMFGKNLQISRSTFKKKYLGCQSLWYIGRKSYYGWPFKVEKKNGKVVKVTVMFQD